MRPGERIQRALPVFVLAGASAAIKHGLQAGWLAPWRDHWVGHAFYCYVLTCMAEPSPAVVAIVVGRYWIPDAAWFALMDLPPALYFGLLLPLALGVVYFANGFLLLELERRFPQLDRIKVQPKVHFDMACLGKVCVNVGMKFALWLPLFDLACVYAGITDRVRYTKQMPGGWECAAATMIGILWNDLTFYIVHRAMHESKWLYKNVHRVHHEFKSPNGLTALYCHPVECITANFLPFSVGVIFGGGHFVDVTIFYFFAVLGTQTHHCGYRWPWCTMEQPEYHDQHHSAFNGNYGNLPFWDDLFGTSFLAMEAPGTAKAKGN